MGIFGMGGQLDAQSMANMNMANMQNAGFSGFQDLQGGNGWDKFSQFGGSFGGAAGGYVANDGSKEDKIQQTKNSATAGLNNVPIVGMFKGIADAAEGIGGAIGGKKGSNIVQGFTDPFGRQIEVFKSGEYNAGQKAIAALFPFLSGFLNPSTEVQDNREAKMNTLAEEQMQKVRDNRFFRESDLNYGQDGSRFY